MGAEELMPYTKQGELAVWETLGRTPQTVVEDVETIKNWMKSQPHLPEVLTDAGIENFLRLNKCSIERTKQKIDNYYTIRNFVPELFMHHPLSPEMLEGYKVWYYTTLPKLVGLHRVIVLKLTDDDPEKLNIELLYSHIMNFAEIRLLHDCALRDIYVFDLTGTRMAHLLRTPFALLQKLQAVADQVYSSRTRAVHIINGFETLLGTMKRVMKPKIRERLHLHKGYDSLYEFIPKEVLPTDFGGEERSLKELTGGAAIQLKCFEEMKDRFDVLVEMKSNEKLRIGKPVNDEFFGFYGNFKKMEVD